MPQAARATLKAGQAIALVTAADLLFSSVEDGGKLEFTVADDVKAEGFVVIAKGAAAVGTLVNAEKRKLFGRGGKITIHLDSVKAVDGQSLKFRAAPVTASAAKSKLKDVALAKDSPLSGFTDQDYAIGLGVARN